MIQEKNTVSLDNNLPASVHNFVNYVCVELSRPKKKPVGIDLGTLSSVDLNLLNKLFRCQTFEGMKSTRNIGVSWLVDLSRVNFDYYQ